MIDRSAFHAQQFLRDKIPDAPDSAASANRLRHGALFVGWGASLHLQSFQYPNAERKRSLSADPKQQILTGAAKVRSWALHLKSGAVTGLAVIPKTEGASVARVSQLMVLNRLTPELVDLILARSPRPSIRGLISEARRMMSL